MVDVPGMQVVQVGYSLRAVFLLVSSGPDAVHHDQYESEGQLCCVMEAALVVVFSNGMCMVGFVG